MGYQAQEHHCLSHNGQKVRPQPDSRHVSRLHKCVRFDLDIQIHLHPVQVAKLSRQTQVESLTAQCVTAVDASTVPERLKSPRIASPEIYCTTFQSRRQNAKLGENHHRGVVVYQCSIVQGGSRIPAPFPPARIASKQAAHLAYIPSAFSMNQRPQALVVSPHSVRLPSSCLRGIRQSNVDFPPPSIVHFRPVLRFRHHGLGPVLWTLWELCRAWRKSGAVPGGLLVACRNTSSAPCGLIPVSASIPI